jgi:hypothetical protein
MGKFNDSLRRELGKNTGKWISNQIFGSSYATPTRIILEREREVRIKEKNAIRAKKEYEKEELRSKRDEVKRQIAKDKLKELELKSSLIEKKRAKKEQLFLIQQEERELRLLEKAEQERLKNEKIDSNNSEAQASQDYLKAIQEIHKVLPAPINFDDLIIDFSTSDYIDIYWKNFLHKKDDINYRGAIRELAWQAAIVDKANALEGKLFSKSESDVDSKIIDILGYDTEADSAFWKTRRTQKDSERFKSSIALLNKGPLIFKYQVLALIDWMVWATSESKNSATSDLELEYVRKVRKELNISSYEYLSISNEFRSVDILSKSNLYNASKLDENDGPTINTDISTYQTELNNWHKNKREGLLKEIDKCQEQIRKLNEDFGSNHWRIDYVKLKSQIASIETDVEEIKAEFKNKMLGKVPGVLKSLFNSSDLDFITDNQLMDRKVKKEQEVRVAKREELINSADYQAYVIADEKIGIAEKKIIKLNAEIKEYEQTQKISVLHLKSSIEKFKLDISGAWDDFKDKMQEDLEMSAYAKKIVDGDYKYYDDFINRFRILEFLNDFECSYRITASKKELQLNIKFATDEVVPKSVKQTRSNGMELVDKELSTSEFNSIMQDFVCSVTLRASNELFANIVILENICVKLFDSKLNTATGKIADELILEVNIDKKRLSSIDISKVDPSDALSLFTPTMKFTKSAGFKAL